MKRRKKKSARQQWDKKLLALWRDVVANRAKHRCEKCGRTSGKLDAHHIFSRRFYWTRWDPANGVYLCVHCHKFGHGSAHEDPESFRSWLCGHIGKDEYMKLYFKSHQPPRRLATIDYEAEKLSLELEKARVGSLNP